MTGFQHLSCPPNGSDNAFFFPYIFLWCLWPVPRDFQRTADSVETADSLVDDPNKVSDLILAPKLALISFWLRKGKLWNYRSLTYLI